MPAYKHTKVPNDTTLFPEPQHWMTWVEDRRWVWDQITRSYGPGPITGEGKLRHYHSLPDAKKGLRWIGNKSQYRAEQERGVFSTDWAVYHWNGSEWEKVYEGFAGEKRDDNPLFQRRFKAGEKIDPVHRKLEEAAIASILEVVHA